MTVEEMVVWFRTKLDIISSEFKLQERPDTATIISFLNIAQEKYIHDKYLNNGSFEDNCKVIRSHINDDLAPLTHEIITQVLPYTYPNPYSYKTTTLGRSDRQYLHYIDSYTLVARTAPKAVTERWVINKATTSDITLEKITSNHYNEPILRNPIAYLDGTDGSASLLAPSILVTLDKYSIIAVNSNFHLRYLRKPKPMDFTSVNYTTTNTCELPDYLHETISELALDLFKKEKFLLTPKGQ